jgi:hypothetical protein
MKIPDNLPDKQEKALLLSRLAIQNIGMTLKKHIPQGSNVECVS